MSLIFFSPFFVWYTIEILKIMIIISDDFKTWQDFDAKNNTREFVCVCHSHTDWHGSQKLLMLFMENIKLSEFFFFKILIL